MAATSLGTLGKQSVSLARLAPGGERTWGYIAATTYAGRVPDGPLTSAGSVAATLRQLRSLGGRTGARDGGVGPGSSRRGGSKIFPSQGHLELVISTRTRASRLNYPLFLSLKVT